jgi:hypothetical protein
MDAQPYQKGLRSHAIQKNQPQSAIGNDSMASTTTDTARKKRKLDKEALLLQPVVGK